MTEDRTLSRRVKPKGLVERSDSGVELQGFYGMVRGRGFEPLNPYGTGS